MPGRRDRRAFAFGLVIFQTDLFSMSSVCRRIAATCRYGSRGQLFFVDTIALLVRPPTLHFQERLVVAKVRKETQVLKLLLVLVERCAFIPSVYKPRTVSVRDVRGDREKVRLSWKNGFPQMSQALIDSWDTFGGMVLVLGYLVCLLRSLGHTLGHLVAKSDCLSFHH